MNKRLFLKNISLIGALILVVYLVGNYTGLVKSVVMDMLNISGSSVQGASTQRAQELSQKISSDITEQLIVVQGQVLNLTVADAISGLSRLEKIPQDIHSLQQFTKEQMDNMVKSKK